MDPHALNTPQAPQPPPSASAAHHSLVAATGEQCSSCGHPVAADQRYCLSCGQRRGEPRLPFMNAVTFMDAMKRRAASPPPPTPKRRRLSPNAALIASVGTLLLAMGVGVLIGRSGNSAGGSTAAAPAQVITVPAGGQADSPTASAGNAASETKKSSKPDQKAAARAKAAAESGKGASEVLHPEVELAPPTVEVGGKCDGGAGCKNGEFTGEFFGE